MLRRAAAQRWGKSCTGEETTVEIDLFTFAQSRGQTGWSAQGHGRFRGERRQSGCRFPALLHAGQFGFWCESADLQATRRRWLFSVAGVSRHGVKERQGDSKGCGV